MPQVKDLILYQIATDRHFKVGDKIYFGQTNNRLAERVYNSKEGQNKSLARLGFDYVEGKFKTDDKRMVELLSKALAERDLSIRELAMEEVRKQIAPELPSRLNCMFLTSKKENVLDSLSHFSVYTTGEFFQGVTVKLNGTIFVAQKSIGRKGMSYQEYLNLSKEYWRQGSRLEDDPAEILFVGDAEIIEVFKEVDIRKSKKV